MGIWPFAFRKTTVETHKIDWSLGKVTQRVLERGGERSYTFTVHQARIRRPVALLTCSSGGRSFKCRKFEHQVHAY